VFLCGLFLATEASPNERRNNTRTSREALMGWRCARYYMLFSAISSQWEKD